MTYQIFTKQGKALSLPFRDYEAVCEWARTMVYFAGEVVVKDDKGNIVGKFKRQDS